MLTAHVALLMPLAHDALANTAPRTRLELATVSTEGGALPTTRALVAILRSLAAETQMFVQYIHPPTSPEIESQ